MRPTADLNDAPAVDAVVAGEGVRLEVSLTIPGQEPLRAVAAAGAVLGGDVVDHLMLEPVVEVDLLPEHFRLLADLPVGGGQVVGQRGIVGLHAPSYDGQ